MMFNSLTFITSLTLISSTMLALTSTSWVCVWMMMELNLMSFIPILMSSNQNMETEASIKYFLVQALGSAMLLLASYSIYFTSNLSSFLNLILMLALLLKLGSFPAFFWFPSVMASINWTSSLILSTWQKIAPITLISMILTYNSQQTFALIAGMNSLIGGIMGMNQTNLRKLLAYSSINHMGWMMSMLYINMPMFCMMYFSLYVMLVLPIFYILICSSTMKQSSNMLNKSKELQLTMIILLLSLAGLPPLTGFLPKLCVMILLMDFNTPLLMVLILGSLMTLYFYLMLAISILNMNSMNYTQSTPKTHYLIPMLNIVSLIYIPIIMFI
nr:TPA: NADH dehydrogenase subunit 2 [Lumbriculus variegatus]